MQLSSYNVTPISNGMTNPSLSADMSISRADIYEYLLVINIDNHLKQQLNEERSLFYDRYKTGIRETDNTSITLMHFRASEDMEATLARWMQRICAQREGFIVTINNYSGYPPNHIHLRVQYTQALQQLARELKVIDNYVRSYGLPAAKISDHPHLTLARRMPEDVYTKAMFDYAQRDFHGSFIASELLLLRRKHEFDMAKRINVFGLLPGLATKTVADSLITF